MYFGGRRRRQNKSSYIRKAKGEKGTVKRARHALKSMVSGENVCLMFQRIVDGIEVETCGRWTDPVRSRITHTYIYMYLKHHKMYDYKMYE